ncbi:hypothetical protein MTR67_018924 [Solanum verrucosum]|uniref:Uncharacterized protein n=1 Tax=Solanum verrucosum TaxID=315347 RepID=A0AAF0TN29_SOLVR|nr:hypothetical protein MTR67_018924 [Solanum verrucosum]
MAKPARRHRHYTYRPRPGKVFIDPNTGTRDLFGMPKSNWDLRTIQSWNLLDQKNPELWAASCFYSKYEVCTVHSDIWLVGVAALEF